MRKVRTAIAPESGTPGSQREGRTYPHSLLFPGSNATYPTGAPCPNHAQCPDGLSARDLVSDGVGGWTVREGRS